MATSTSHPRTSGGSAAPSPSRRGPAGSRGLAWAVLAGAVLQVVAPVVQSLGLGSSPGEGAGADLLITPVGWAFSIWGVIYTLALAQAVAVLVRGADSVPRALQVAQVVLYLGGAVWIVCAAVDSSVATAAALLVMAVAGVAGALVAARSALPAGWFGALTRAAAGLYGGWVTAALFLNLSTAAVALDLADVAELGWQLGALAVAAATLVVVTLATRGLVAYAVAGGWALVGIAVTGSADGTTAVVVTALVALAVLAGATLLAQRRASR